MIRKYQAIWDRIKNNKNHEVVLEVHPALFARVVKAVIKEKHRDAGYKLINNHGDGEYLFLDVIREPEKKRLTFRLRQRLGLEDLKNVN